MWTRTTAVETIRHRSFFPQLCASRTLSTNPALSTAAKAELPPLGSLLTAANVAQNNDTQLQHTAYIAIGSNVGNRAAHINKALKLLDDPRRLYTATPSASPILKAADSPDPAGQRFAQLVDTSMLYESEPMYVLEQDRFLNGVCKVCSSAR
jgi:dihydroneopterin aldolase/2-amino-4-hydroxy-6-hydroxymethyldihydropteridine diphosphokinase/dihydropteroate synthase